MSLLCACGVLYAAYKIANRSSELAARRFEESTVKFEEQLAKRKYNTKREYNVLNEVKDSFELFNRLMYVRVYETPNDEEARRRVYKQYESFLVNIRGAIAGGSLPPDEADALILLSGTNRTKAGKLIDLIIERDSPLSYTDIEFVKSEIKKIVTETTQD